MFTLIAYPRMSMRLSVCHEWLSLSITLCTRPLALVVLDVLTLYHNIFTQPIVVYSTLANAERALF